MVWYCWMQTLVRWLVFCPGNAKRQRRHDHRGTKAGQVDCIPGPPLGEDQNGVGLTEISPPTSGPVPYATRVPDLSNTRKPIISGVLGARGLLVPLSASIIQ